MTKPQKKEIEQLAHHLYVWRDKKDGHAQADWFLAETLLKKQYKKSIFTLHNVFRCCSSLLVTLATVAMAYFAYQLNGISSQQKDLSYQQAELNRKINEPQVGLNFNNELRVELKNYGKLAAENSKVICQHIVAAHDKILSEAESKSDIQLLYPEEPIEMPVRINGNPDKNAEFLICVWTYDGNKVPRRRIYVRSGEEPWTLTTQSLVHSEQWKMVERKCEILTERLITNKQGDSLR